MTPSQAAQKRRHCLDCGRPLDMDPKVYDPEGIGCRTCDASQAATSPRTEALRAALSLARSMVLSGEPMSAQANAVFEEAFASMAEREAAAATPSLDVERLRDAVIRVVGVEIDLIDAAEIAELARLDEGSATPTEVPDDRT